MFSFFGDLEAPVKLLAQKPKKNDFVVISQIWGGSSYNRLHVGTLQPIYLFFHPLGKLITRIKRNPSYLL